MTTSADRPDRVRPVVEVITSERTLEGGGFDERLSSLRSPCFARKPGQPSLACPLGGAAVRRAAANFRLAPGAHPFGARDARPISLPAKLSRQPTARITRGL